MTSTTQKLATTARLVLAGPGLVLLSTTTSGGGGGGGGGGGAPSGLVNVGLFGQGQSNAMFANDSDGALLAAAQAAAFYLQASAPAAYSQAGVTDYSGAGSYEDGTGDVYPYFLSYNGAVTASAAAAASVSSIGAGCLAYITALSSTVRGQICGIVSYWGETDSVVYSYSQKAVVKAALENLLAQERAAIGKTAALCPAFLFGPPYGSAAPAAMMREIWAEIAADSTQNAVWLCRQTYDSMTRGDSYNAATGVGTSTSQSNNGHRDSVDNVRYYRNAGLAMARAILASNGLPATDIPAALGNGIGPQITAVAISGVTLTVTVTHDGGTALVMPSLSSPNGTDAPLPAQGVGFAVMDGGSVASPGTIIQAVAAAIVDATHFTVTLASAPAHGAGQRLLLYPWPGTTWTDQPRSEIGRGCAITDNFASVTKPSGFDINAGLGAGWATNMPICPPLGLSGGVASYGFVF